MAHIGNTAMARFWVIAPFDYQERDVWNKVWEYDLKHGIISLGWDSSLCRDDISSLHKEQLLALYRKQNRDVSDVEAQMRCGMLYQFYQVKPGDRVIARRGRKEVAAIGTVKSEAYYYDLNKRREARDAYHPGTPFAHHLDVEWKDGPRDITFPNMVFGMQTIHKISEEKVRALTQGQVRLPEEVIDGSVYPEGGVQHILVNRYERDPRARAECIRHYRTTCFLCRFDFVAVYGEVMEGFTHIHHLKPLSSVGTDYKVDPIRDLRPVCPNCHAVLHRREPPYSLDEVHAFLQARTR
jgi:hypothetical protein